MAGEVVGKAAQTEGGSPVAEVEGAVAEEEDARLHMIVVVECQLGVMRENSRWRSVNKTLGQSRQFRMGPLKHQWEVG